MPIAVVGYGCVFPPDATDPRKFWDNISAGVSGIGLPPVDRWSWELYFDKDKDAPERTYCRYGGFVRDYEFRNGERAAARGTGRLNRTQQFALDVCCQALDGIQGGYESLTRDRSALVMGNMLGDELWGEASLNYRAAQVLDHVMEHPVLRDVAEDARKRIRDGFAAAVDERFLVLDPAEADLLLPTELPRAVGEVLGVNGPSFVVDGACAGGLLVVDCATRLLQSRSVDVVLAVAVMANMSVTGNVAFAKIGGLSPDVPRPLDTTANGLIPAEGAGAVVLKRLDDAIAAGDPVIGVIRGVASRTDGKGKAIYAPSSRGQMDAMNRALELAQWSLRDIDHVETHATATPAGDKVEVTSLSNLARAHTPALEPRSISLGSVKGLIGHAFPAAGMANLIKILVSLEREEIAPTVGVRSPLPLLESPGSPFVVHDSPVPWRSGGRRRRALANAFGFGGVNASICIEEFRAGDRADGAGRPFGRRPRSGRVAVVGVGVAAGGMVDPAAVSSEPAAPGGYPVSRSHARCGAIYDPERRWRVHALDFDFPWGEFKIPPDTLDAIDRSQQMALLVTGKALKDCKVPVGPRTGVVVGAMAGLEIAMTRNLMIRAVEYGPLMERVLAEEASRTKGCDSISAADVVATIRSALETYISPTTETALPGYMDNIVPGRIANRLDLRGANLTVDAGRASFAVALDLGMRLLEQEECDALLVGGVSANLSDELLLALGVGNRDDGAVPAEGAAFFVLKPVECLEASDRVYACIDEVGWKADVAAGTRDVGASDYLGAAGAMSLAEALADSVRKGARTVGVPIETGGRYDILVSPFAEPLTDRDGSVPGKAPSDQVIVLPDAGHRAPVSAGSPGAGRCVWSGMTLTDVRELLEELAAGREPSAGVTNGRGEWNVGLSWNSAQEIQQKARAALVALATAGASLRSGPSG